VKRKLIAVCLLFVVFAFLPAMRLLAESEGEQPELAELIGEPVRIDTEGRGNFQGILLSVGPDRVEIEGSDGEITQISRRTITEVQVIASDAKGRSFYQDSAANRLLVIPTGFAMEPGEFHIADQELVVVTGSYGLGDHVSFWAGISPVAAVFSGRFIATIAETFAISVGSFAGLEWVGTTSSAFSGMVLPYGLASYGKSNNNVTIGGGPAFFLSTDTGLETVGAVAVLGGKLVLTATTALVTENWVVWGKRYSLAALEPRWDALPLFIVPGLVFRIAGMRFSWDIGAVLPLQSYYDVESNRDRIGGLGGGVWIPIPWISVTYRIR
jgi:hypothetical protein